MKSFPTSLSSSIEVQAKTLGFNLVPIKQVLDLRRQHGRNANRRRLFASFDSYFAGTDAKKESSSLSQSGGRVELKKIALRNWKVFEHVEFDFPSFDSKRTVVLIGGQNGYGKTSLLEAILFGMFGRDAIGQEYSALRESSIPGARSQAYRGFLERAFHRPARDRGDGVVQILLEWATPDGLLAIERKWYFDDAGVLAQEDEVLTLREGASGTILAVPENIDPHAFFQSEIHSRLMPPSLGALIFFDGEKVKRFSERSYADQVRIVVESALGISEWRTAVLDLKDYVRDRSRVLVRDESHFERLSVEVQELRQQEKSIKFDLVALESRLLSPRSERDALLAAIGSGESKDFASLQRLLEQRHANSVEQTRVQAEISGAAAANLPFGLAGKKLRSKTLAKIVSLANSKVDSQSAFDDTEILKSFLKSFRALAPSKANKEREKAIEARIKTAWKKQAQALSAKENGTHSLAYITDNLLAPIRQRLSEEPDVRSIQRHILVARSLAEEARLLGQQIAIREENSTALANARAKLQEINLELDELDARSRELERSMGTILNQLQPKAAELAVLESAKGGSPESATAAKNATLLAAEIERIIEELKPTFFKALADAFSTAYCSLAHKGVVAKIDISSDGAVSLLDSSGRNLDGVESSAGEGHIFAMSLMAAVGELSGLRFPVIIDTPLGRLDPTHRERILNYFTQRPVQTILLSQPDEVSGRYLRLIEPRVSSQFRLDHMKSASGLGESSLSEGYFSEVAA